MVRHFTNTSLIVLISIVFVAGIGTAYAGISLPTITLGGNVEVLGDMKFTSDDTSVTFPATSSLNSPMIEMFSSGVSNNDRMVIGHSPNFPDWGLEYRDVPDEFVFKSDTVDVVTIGLNNPSFECNECIDSSDIATGAVGSSEIATASVGSSEIATAAVGSSEIATDAVGSSEIATDAVGADELAGVSKMIYTSCTFDPPEIAAGDVDTVDCTGTGVLIDSSDQVIVTSNKIGSSKIIITSAWGINDNNKIRLYLYNPTSSAINEGINPLSVIAYAT